MTKKKAETSIGDVRNRELRKEKSSEERGTDNKKERIKKGIQKFA